MATAPTSEQLNALKKLAQERYGNHELIPHLVEDAVKRGSVAGILDGTRGLPSKPDALRWWEHYKRTQSAEAGANVPSSDSGRSSHGRDNR